MWGQDGDGIMYLEATCSASANAFNTAMDRLRSTLARDTVSFGSLNKFGDQRFALYPTQRALPGYSVPRDLAGILGITTHQVYANLWFNDQGQIMIWVKETETIGHLYHQCFSGFKLTTDASPLRALQHVIRKHGYLQNIQNVAKPFGYIAFTTMRDGPVGSVDSGRPEFGKVFVYDINYLYSGFKFETSKYKLMLRFDPTSSLVMVDFLMRHDLLGNVPRHGIPRLEGRLRFN